MYGFGGLEWWNGMVKWTGLDCNGHDPSQAIIGYNIYISICVCVCVCVCGRWLLGVVIEQIGAQQLASYPGEAKLSDSSLPSKGPGFEARQLETGTCCSVSSYCS